MLKKLIILIKSPKWSSSWSYWYKNTPNIHDLKSIIKYFECLFLLLEVLIIFLKEKCKFYHTGTGNGIPVYIPDYRWRSSAFGKQNWEVTVYRWLYRTTGEGPVCFLATKTRHRTTGVAYRTTGRLSGPTYNRISSLQNLFFPSKTFGVPLQNGKPFPLLTQSTSLLTSMPWFIKGNS